MKRNEIMKKFTAKVAELMAQGMWIHGDTMRGTQGEICKVDLTDGQRMVRFLLADGRTDFHDTIELIVGEAKGTRWQSDCAPTVWNDDLNEIERRVFHKVRRDWFVDSIEEMERIHKIHEARVEARRLENQNWNGDIKVELPGAAEKVLPFVRRQPRCKSVRLNQITSVYKTIRKYRGTVEVRYIVETNNKQLCLNAKEA